MLNKYIYIFTVCCKIKYLFKNMRNILNEKQLNTYRTQMLQYFVDQPCLFKCPTFISSHLDAH